MFIEVPIFFMSSDISYFLANYCASALNYWFLDWRVKLWISGTS